MKEIEKILAYHRNDSGRAADPGERKKRVLVVEGDGFTRITLMNWLVTAGFEVDFAPNGRLGWHQLGMWQPDALIMELHLRDLSGLEFIFRARQDRRFKERPIYVFTSTHFARRAALKELAAMGVQVFDKLTVAPETLVMTVATELLGRVAQGELSVAGNRVNNGEWQGAAGGLNAAGLRQNAERRNAGSGELEAVPDDLSESMGEIWLRAKSLARCAGPMQRVVACTELREEVYSLLSHAAVGGHRRTTRQAQALVDFLDHLCEESQHVSDAAMATVARSVEVLSGLAHETSGESQELSQFRVVVVGETPAWCQSIQEAFYDSGLEPVAFADPALALEHLAAEPADLIITNLSSAGQEAFGLARIRALELHQDTPVLVAPEVAPESGDGSLSADVPVADFEPAGHPGLLMQSLNILQRPAAGDALAASVPADVEAPINQVAEAPESETSAVGSAEDWGTSVWTRPDTTVPTEVNYSEVVPTTLPAEAGGADELNPPPGDSGASPTMEREELQDPSAAGCADAGQQGDLPPNFDGELARLRQIHEELVGRSREQGARSRELEQQLEEVSAELERTRAELVKQGDVRALAEAELRQQLAETNADRQRVQARCSQFEEELAELRRIAEDLMAKVAGQEERASELERRSKDLENQLCLNQKKHARVVADLEQERARLLITGEQLQKTHELNGRYEQHIAALEEANKVLLASQEELQTLLKTNLGKLHETEARLQRENSSLSEELHAARRAAAIESDQWRLESSKQRAAIQYEQLERSRVETSNARLRHAATNANRNGRLVRQNLRHQVRHAVEDLLESVERLVALENRPDQAALVGELQEKLFRLKGDIEQPSIAVRKDLSPLNHLK